MNEKYFIKQLLYVKGYKLTNEAFIEEEKINRNKKKINYFVELIKSSIQSSDVESLCRLWSEYEISYFKYVDFDKQRNADFLKSEMFKAYLIECHKNKRTEKINQFFLSFKTLSVGNKNDWIDWFEFPFVKSIPEHRVFGVYCTRSWLDCFYLSLFNFFLQVMRSTMTNESRLERFFTLDMGLDQCHHDFLNNEVEVVRKQYNLPDTTENRSLFVDQLMLSLSQKSRNLHDVTELLCDFRLTSDKKQFQVKKISGINKAKGLGAIIQNKTKITSVLSPKTIFHINIENNDVRENLERIEERNDRNATSDKEEVVQSTLKDDNDSTSSTNSAVIVNFSSIIPLEQERTANEVSGIRQLSNKISQRIFKAKPITEAPKPIIYHEHFSMVTHVKFSRMPTPTWASLDVGGTFKVWSTNEVAKSLLTLSIKHTIYSFDWVSCTTDLILLGTKYGSVKLFDLTANNITNEMTIDSLYPRVNIVQSFDNDAKFVCESLDHSRATLSGSSLPQGAISLYDAEKWSIVRESIMSLDSQYTVNCINCWSNMVVTGCSSGCVKMLDIRVPGDMPIMSVCVFDNEEVVNMVRMCESKWPISAIDSNILTCFGSKSHIKLLDIRNPSESFRQDPWQLNNLSLPLSWSERPHGGEQTIYIPRSNLISKACVGNDVLFSAAGRGIHMHKLSTCNLFEPTFIGCGHNSPILCMDSSPTDCCDRNTAVVLTGAMEGTIAALKITNKI